MKAFFLSLPLLLGVAGVLSARAAEQRVEVTRDLWISSYVKEREGSNGGSPKLKLKGIQEFFLIDFDPAALRGKRVVRAQLHVHLEGPETLGRITVSSVADEWEEGRGTGYARTAGASCFRWARTDGRAWAGDGVDITGAILGELGSVWGFGDASTRDAEGWQVIPIAPEVVQARLDGRSHGFCVMDDVGSEYTRSGNTIEYRQFPNRYVASREGKRGTAPYFTLWVEDGPAVVASASSVGTAGTRQAAVAMAKLPPAPKLPAAATALPVPFRDQFGEALTSLEFFAARGEAIGFSTSAVVAAVDLPGVKTARFSLPLVGGHEDPAVPVGFVGAPAGSGGTPAGSGGTPAGSGGTPVGSVGTPVGSVGTPVGVGATFVEIQVPKAATAGRHVGSIRVGEQTIPCAVTVWDFTLPDRLSFIPQMNCYSLPGHERAYYRLAQEHRTTLNRLPYGWTGRIKAGPTIGADGAWDWSRWDAEYGPVLDGSAFADLPRGAVPIEAFYLPLNENWPMDHEKHFRGGYWIESAYDDAYWAEFRQAAARFAEHLAAKGWTGPVFEFYLNNKVSFKDGRGWDACSAAWILDEPMHTQDFWALRRFGLEFWRGVGAQPGVRFGFRADISRPEWQRDLLDGVTSVEVMSGALRTYRERVQRRAEKFGNLVYMYGAANRIGTPNIMPAAWCVETWALGADGVVPWQTVGKADAWTKPDDLSLFYPTPNGPVPSLRLKSFRAGQQLVEYLTLYTALSGESRAAVGAAVLELPGMRASLDKKSEADAGTSLFNASAHQSLGALRLGLGEWLNAKAPKPRERWHDPRPAGREPAMVREIGVVRSAENGR